MSLLEVKDLHVSFSIHGRKLSAVRGVCFTVEAGEIVGLVGESGCGKSATVQALLRLDPSQQIEGKVLFNGENLITKSIQQLNQIRGPQIGMVFQDPMTSLNPTMTIGNQIAEGLIYHKLATPKAAFQKALELLDLVGISDPKYCITQYPHALSGGMRQRVLIAIAIACNPKLIIADEPTTALDVTISSQILTLLKSLCRRLETSLLLITHDLSVVASVCDRVLVMYAGKIVESGPVEEIFYRPKHPYTKRLLQSIPRIDRPKTNRLVAIEGSPPSLFAQFSGCPFAVRCPSATEQCHKEEPKLVNELACWNPNVEVDITPPPIKRAEWTSESKEMDNWLDIRAVTKTFKKVTAVNNVSLQIRRGEILGLVGESGCGKSTLSRLLMRLEKPNSGQIYFEGNEISTSKDRALCRSMQMIFQDPYASLNPRMTVNDLISEPLIIHKIPVANTVSELLDLVGLPQNAKYRFPHEFSGGQRQRIGIARALSLKPKFLVCDEPISALDVSTQAQIVDLLLNLHREFNLTYLFIAHDLARVRYLSNRIAVMYLGEIVELADTDTLFESPKHPYTQLLLASASIPDPILERSRPRPILTLEQAVLLPTPNGCPFASQCPKAKPLCREVKPTLTQISQDHSLACHYPNQ